MADAWTDTGLALRGSIQDKVREYNRAIEVVDHAYADLRSAEEILNTAFPNGHGRSFTTLPRMAYHEHTADDVKTQIRMTAWRNLVELLEIRKVLSIQRAEALDKALDDPKAMPEITVESVFEWSKMLMDNADAMAKEAVREVFDWLRPRPDSVAGGYKTNQKNARFELGKKIILTWVCENGYSAGKFRVNHHREKNLVALDRVFHVLDGKGIPDGYRSPLVDAINTTVGGDGETDYFKFHCYQNNNVHIEFKRLDLLARLNAVAGGANLKGE